MKNLFWLLILILLLISPTQTSAESEVEKLVFENVEIKPEEWKGLTFKKGQIGLIEIEKKINLWKIIGDKQEFIRVLKPGEKYRVYSFDQQYGGQYGLGGGLYITNISGSIKYSTPPKNLVLKVSPKIYVVKVEEIGGAFFSLDVGTSEKGQLFLKIEPSSVNINFTARESSNKGIDGSSIVFSHDPFDYKKWDYSNKEQYWFQEYSDIYNRFSDNWFYLMGTHVDKNVNPSGKYFLNVTSLPMYGTKNQAVIKGFYMVGGPTLDELQKKIVPDEDQYLVKVQSYYRNSDLILRDFSSAEANYLNSNFVVYPPEGGRQIMSFLAADSPLVTDGYNRFLILDTVFNNEDYLKIAAKSLVTLGYPATEKQILVDLKKVKENGDTIGSNNNAFIKRSNYIKDVYIMWKN